MKSLRWRFFIVEGGSTYLGAVMDGLLPRSVLDSIRLTAKSLTGYTRRVFQAVIANEHAEGKPRRAETLFGWNRDAVRRGLCEERIGHEIRTISSSKGRPRVETLNKDLLPTAKNLLEEAVKLETKPKPRQPIMIWAVNRLRHVEYWRSGATSFLSNLCQGHAQATLERHSVTHA